MRGWLVYRIHNILWEDVELRNFSFIIYRYDKIILRLSRSWLAHSSSFERQIVRKIPRHNIESEEDRSGGRATIFDVNCCMMNRMHKCIPERERGGGGAIVRPRRRCDVGCAVSMSWWSGTRDGSSVIICSFTMAAIEGRTPLVPSLVPCYPERRRRPRRLRLLGKKSPRFRPASSRLLRVSLVTCRYPWRTLPVRTNPVTTDDGSVTLELEQPRVCPWSWEHKDRCSSSASQADWHCLSFETWWFIPRKDIIISWSFLEMLYYITLKLKPLQ